MRWYIFRATLAFRKYATLKRNVLWFYLTVGERCWSCAWWCCVNNCWSSQPYARLLSNEIGHLWCDLSNDALCYAFSCCCRSISWFSLNVFKWYTQIFISEISFMLDRNYLTTWLWILFEFQKICWCNNCFTILKSFISNYLGKLSDQILTAQSQFCMNIALSLTVAKLFLVLYVCSMNHNLWNIYFKSIILCTVLVVSFLI